MTTSLEWIRRNYNVPARKGMEVLYRGAPAVIVAGNGHYLRLRPEGWKNLVSAHPTEEVVYPELPLPHLPRGWCEHCLEERALRADGTMQRHVRPGSRHFPVTDRQCPGACQKPWAVCSWTVPREKEEEST